MQIFRLKPSQSMYYKRSKVKGSGAIDKVKVNSIGTRPIFLVLSSMHKSAFIKGGGWQPHTD